MSLGPVSWAHGPAPALLTLLIAGHVIADFLVQKPGNVERGDAGRGYASHGAAVFVTHAVVLSPMLTTGTAAALLLVALSHLALDWIVDRRDRGRR